MGFFNSLRRLQMLGVVLAVVGIADSIYLWYTKVTANQFVCGVGDCDLVNASPYSTLLGIPVAAIGAGGYAALLALTMWALYAGQNAPHWLTDARLFLASMGLLFAAYLTALELFVIHAI